MQILINLPEEFVNAAPEKRRDGDESF